MKGKALMNTVGNMDPNPANDLINREGLPRRRKRGRQYDSPSMASKRMSAEELERKRRREESDARVAEYRSGKRS